MWDSVVREPNESESVEAIYGMSAETLNNLDEIVALYESQEIEA